MKNKRIEDLSKKSGEANVKPAPRFVLPNIRLQGKKGHFKETTFGEEGNAETKKIGDELSGVMLKVRQKYIQWSTDWMLYTNEHDSQNDVVSLFQRVKTREGEWGKAKLVQRSTGSELRNDPKVKLRTKKIIYLLKYPEKKIYKLSVKGAGLSPLFEYWQGFESDEHIFQYVSKMGISQETSKLGDYYAMTFERGKKLGEKELELVADEIDKIDKSLQEIKEYYARRQQKVEEEQKAMAEGEASLELDEEEIDVDKIPF